jgi:hypothetical protein
MGRICRKGPAGRTVGSDKGRRVVWTRTNGRRSLEREPRSNQLTEVGNYTEYTCEIQNGDVMDIITNFPTEKLIYTSNTKYVKSKGPADIIHYSRHI